jgi:hypothetical protein
LTGSVAEDASIAAQQSRERVFTIACTFNRFAKNTPPADLVIVMLLSKTWQISESLSGR